MKTSKFSWLLVMVLTMFMMTNIGCSTFSGTTPKQAAVDACLLSSATVGPAARIAVNVATRDETNRLVLIHQISEVGVTLEELSKNGVTDPTSVLAAFKVDNVYINGVLKSAVAFYSAMYPSLSQDETGEAAIQVVGCIGEDLQIELRSLSAKYPELAQPKLRTATAPVVASGLRPGMYCPKSGQYRSSATGKQATCVKGERMPPTKKGATWKLTDETRHVTN